jgi:hypothetical protein
VVSRGWVLGTWRYQPTIVFAAQTQEDAANLGSIYEMRPIPLLLIDFVR